VVESRVFTYFFFFLFPLTYNKVKILQNRLGFKWISLCGGGEIIRNLEKGIGDVMFLGQYQYSFGTFNDHKEKEKWIGEKYLSLWG